VTDRHAIRQLNKGFADAVSRSFEFVATIAMFTGLGWLLDHFLGTAPVFLVILTVLGFAGNLLRSWYAYDATMRKLEAELPSRQTRPDAEAVGS
jgi:F0F1-type ATP synthase assembly protein I